MDAISRDGKVLLLAYDQGFEHGPTDFDAKNVDPAYVLDIAVQSQVYSGVVLHQGIAEKYYDPSKHPPLILKLNGKTGFHTGEELLSLQLTSVGKAVELGAAAVGYTVYVSSEHEEQMLVEFRRICDQAHSSGLPVIAWMYPRGQHVAGLEIDKDVVAYAARLGLELGADYVKVPYTGDVASFKWVVASAGKTGVLVQGGIKQDAALFLQQMQDAMAAGSTGVAVGRNIWQSDDPIDLSKKLASVIFKS